MINSHEKFKNDTINTTSSESKIKSTRGLILDANGVVLADNKTVWRVFISPSDMNSEAEKKEVSSALSRILDINYDVIYEKCGYKKQREGSRIREEET